VLGITSTSWFTRHSSTCEFVNIRPWPLLPYLKGLPKSCEDCRTEDMDTEAMEGWLDSPEPLYARLAAQDKGDDCNMGYGTGDSAGGSSPGKFVASACGVSGASSGALKTLRACGLPGGISASSGAGRCGSRDGEASGESKLPAGEETLTDIGPERPRRRPPRVQDLADQRLLVPEPSEAGMAKLTQDPD